MTGSSSADEARKALGGRLRELREGARLTAVELARLMDRHAAKVSRIEHGKALPTEDDIRAWCLHCDAVDQAADLIASLKAVEGMWIEWRRMERTGLRHAQAAVRPLYDRTRTFRTYSPNLVPGILQTEAYTREILIAHMRRRALPDDIDSAVAVRMERQRYLRQGDHRFAVLMEETALWMGIGGVDLMAEQLRHLIEVSKLPNVSFGIIPAAPNRHLAWPVEGFWMFDDAQVAVELVSGYLTLTQPREVAMYAQAFTEMSSLARFGQPMRALVESAACRRSDST